MTFCRIFPRIRCFFSQSCSFAIALFVAYKYGLMKEFSISFNLLDWALLYSLSAVMVGFYEIRENLTCIFLDTHKITLRFPLNRGRFLFVPVENGVLSKIRFSYIKDSSPYLHVFPVFPLSRFLEKNQC